MISRKGESYMEVTLKDIAKECNVSFSTVSKALKNSPEISQKTIELVNSTAMALGYHPNAAARALRTNRSYNIGVIFEDITGSGLQHQYFAKIFDAINATANKADYDITFLSNGGKQNYLAQAKYRGCDGVIIANASFRRSDVRELLESDIPICTLDKAYKNLHSSVISDNKEGFRALLEWIIKRGHRKIAFVHGESSEVTKVRMSVFNAIQKKYNLEIPAEWIIEATYHMPPSTRDATEKILAMKDKPTCIVYPDDFSALGGLDALHKHKLTPGKDISVAGYDGIFLATVMTPPLTTYEQNTEELGRQLVTQLLANIEYSSSFAPSTIKVSGRLLEGQTVADLSNS